MSKASASFGCERRTLAGISRGRLAALFAVALVALGIAAQSAAADPIYGHPYRHGLVPGRFLAAQPFWSGNAAAWTKAHHQPHQARARAFNWNDMSFGGGVGGVGVTTGAPKVYLVFWGSQWGTQGTSGGNVTLSGDPQGVAPDLQAFFKGLGVNNELWSGVMTQYCEGVASGTQTCPGTAPHVGYPTGGALAGVWVDDSAPSPQSSTAHQLAQEALAAAQHFGNTTAAANRNAQYFIVSPTNTNPDQYNGPNGYCAWHDYTGDSTMDGGGAVGSAFGPIAFTNLPYIPDAGWSCGANFVNSGASGQLDGVTIVGGHEYAETITDQFPAGGWTDYWGNENGDLCAWISSGQGASQNITLATGTFAVQSTWANDYNGGQGGCEISHPIVTNSTSSGGGGGANTVTVTNPGNRSTRVNHATSLQIQAKDSSSSATLSYSASGLPRGLSINSASGLISGTPNRRATYSVSVTVTDNTGAKGSTSFTWTITR